MLQIAFIVLLAAAATTEVSARQDLLPNYPIDSSPKELVARSDSRLLEETTVNDGARPRFHHQVFAIDGTIVFGIRAELRMEFYNGQLMQMDLYPHSPSDLSRARVALSSMHGVEPMRLREGMNSDGLQVQEAEDFQGRSYLSVTVTCVYRKFERWIKKYS